MRAFRLRSIALVAVLALWASATPLAPAVAAAPDAPSLDSVQVAGPTSVQLGYSTTPGATSYSYILNGGSPVSMGTTQPFTVTGLTTGAMACFEITATSTDGTSDRSGTRCAIPGALQNPTTRLIINNITSTAPGTIAIAYTRPSDPAGMDAINIRVDGQFFAWAYDLRSPLIVSGLAQGATRSIQIKGGAIGYMPDTLFSDPYVVTVASGSPAAPIVRAPSAPAITIVETTSTSVRYRVELSTEDGGQSPYVYASSVTASDGKELATQSFNPNERERTVSGLVPGATYVIGAQARNDGGWSATTRTVVTSKLGVPGAPQNVAAAGGVRSATVTWSPPASDGGAAIDGYNVTVGERSIRVSPSQSSVVINDLPSWSSFPITVTALNMYGAGVPGTTSVTTAQTGPSAPRNLRAETIDEGMVRLTWDPPVDLGDPGKQPLKYVAYVDGAFAACGMQKIAGGAVIEPITDTSCVAAGLPQRTALTFSVSVQSAASPAATVRHTIVPERPDAPTDVRATTDGQLVRVTWTAPVNARRAGVERYVVRARADGALGETDIDLCAIDAPAVGCAAVLPVRSAYKIVVVAVNAEGDGRPSAPYDYVISRPVALPQVMPIVSNATSSQLTATLWVTLPGERLSDPTLSYRVALFGPAGNELFATQLPPNESVDGLIREQLAAQQRMLSDDGSPLLPRAAAAMGTAVPVDGLAPGTTYEVEIAAQNAAGTGRTVREPFMTPPAQAPALPGVPLNVVASQDEEVFILTWNAPSTGGPVVSYRVWTSAGSPCSPTLSGQKWTCRAEATGVGKTVRYRVGAVNAGGVGAEASGSLEMGNRSLRAGYPGLPQNLDVVQWGDKGRIVSWQPPLMGAPVREYLVCGWFAATANETTCRTASASDRQAYIPTGDTVGVSADGPTGLNSGFARITPGSTQLPAVTSLAARAVNAGLEVAWTTPDFTGARAATGFTIRAFACPDTCDGSLATGAPVFERSVDASTRSVSVTGLINRTQYLVEVVPVGRSGAGAKQSAVATPRDPRWATAVQTLTANSEGDGIRVRWTAPAFLGTGFTAYRVTVGDREACRTQQLSCFISDVPFRQPVTIVVEAVGSAGPGDLATTSAQRALVPVTPIAEYEPGDEEVLVTVRLPEAIIPFVQRSSVEVFSQRGGSRTGCVVQAEAEAQCVVRQVSNDSITMMSVVTTYDDGATRTSPMRFVLGIDAEPNMAGSPSMPKNVDVSRSGNTATVSWSRPAYDGGSATLEYVVFLLAPGTTYLVGCGTRQLSCSGRFEARWDAYAFVSAKTTSGKFSGAREFGPVPGS